MLHEPAWEFYDIGVASGQRKTLMGPEFAPDQGKGIGEAPAAAGTRWVFGYQAARRTGVGVWSACW